jgi:hypothetical protein
MRRVVVATTLLVLLWSPRLGQTQLPVTDVGAFGQRVVQIGQGVLQIAEAVAQTANMILELTPVDELIAADGIIEDMGLLAEIVAEARLLSADFASLTTQIQVLFALETAPATRSELDARLLEIKRTIYDARLFAVRTQALMATVLRTAEHLSALLASIGSFVGNMQANQRVAELQGTTNKTLAVLEVHTAAFQRVDLLDRLSADLVRESMARIQENRLADWPQGD